jgi:glucose-6-phosphate isomerase
MEDSSRLQAQYTSEGIVTGRNVSSYRKLFREIAEIYQNPEGMNPAEVMYDVYSYTEGQPQAGNLQAGLTVLYPVLVNGECSMTRGHWHADCSCAEIYAGIRGTGLLLLMNDAGETWTEQVFPGSVHHIDGSLAHRLVNTGDEPLRVGAVWSCAAGHDYEAVAAHGFGLRIYRDASGIVMKKAGAHAD